MTSGAGVVIPPSLGSAVEFGRREFDAKVGRQCRPGSVADSERTERDSSERKRSDSHVFPVSSLRPLYTAFRGSPPEASPRIDPVTVPVAGKIVALAAIAKRP